MKPSKVNVKLNAQSRDESNRPPSFRKKYGPWALERDLVEHTGVSHAGLYSTFGDKGGRHG